MSKGCIVAQDLSEQNILVDDAGRISGILGWKEALFAAPFWLRTKLPRFLFVCECGHKPNPHEYADATEEDYSISDNSVQRRRKRALLASFD